MNADHDNIANPLDNSEVASPEALEAMGISQPVYAELYTIVGHQPTVDELSTLLAMWTLSGRRQGLLSWLKGQPHIAQRNDYIVNDAEPESQAIREPRVKDCLDIARQLFPPRHTSAPPQHDTLRHSGDALYMVGDVSELFVNSDYGRQYLHLVENAITLDSNDETRSYIEMILNAFADSGTILTQCPVGRGGLFGTLLRCAAPAGLGFDIICCREVRLDAFLFGEQGVRYLVSIEEPQEDFFLVKLTEARLNCCFLGRVTKGRIVVDSMDFGSVGAYSPRE